MNYRNRVSAVTGNSFILTFALNEMLDYYQCAKQYRNEIEKIIIEAVKRGPLNSVNYYVSETGHSLLTHLKERPLPTLDRSVFAFPSSGLRLDASENIVSVKLKYIGKGNTYLESLIQGIEKGDYVFMPRVAIKTKNNGLQFLAPFESPDAERETGELKVLGFDFFYKVTHLSIESSDPVSELEDMFKKVRGESKGWSTKDYPNINPLNPIFYDGVRLDIPTPSSAGLPNHLVFPTKNIS